MRRPLITGITFCHAIANGTNALDQCLAQLLQLHDFLLLLCHNVVELIQQLVLVSKTALQIARISGWILASRSYCETPNFRSSRVSGSA